MSGTLLASGRRGAGAGDLCFNSQHIEPLRQIPTGHPIIGFGSVVGDRTNEIFFCCRTRAIDPDFY
jgi:hypothetical protein